MHTRTEDVTLVPTKQQKARSKGRSAKAAPPAIPPPPRVTSTDMRRGTIPPRPPDTPRLPSPPPSARDNADREFSFFMGEDQHAGGPRPGSIEPEGQVWDPEKGAWVPKKKKAVEPNVVLHAGWLLKKSDGKGRSPGAAFKKRWCVVMSGKGLLYFRSPEHPHAIGAVHVTEMRAAGGTGRREFHIEPRDPDDERTYRFRVPDGGDAEVWRTAVTKAILLAADDRGKPAADDRERARTLSEERVEEELSNVRAEADASYKSMWEERQDEDLSKFI